ncbi:BON domain-containing protein [Paludisphaera rhizosphaerae]|uniref:BON domain-containing protein n=1 Tax=Paludisphaera rhizosphaerae TaxID=2711216 RepID=UPI0013EC4971|nr:BON domain-containing protein [Paludisphaera rhizosphaerae]
MSGIRRFGAAATLGAMLAVGGASAWGLQEPGPIERAGASLDEAGRSLRQGLERGFNRTREAVRESFERTRDKVNDMSIEARVYGRLHWDKMLESSTFDISSEGPGILTIRGSVPSAEARKHAVDLAADTVGVTRVVDQLAVQTTTRTIESETAPAPGSTPATRVRPAPAPRATPAPEPKPE